MGVRACVHDGAGRIRRAFVGRRWVICVLQFKGRRRPIMAPGRYTELFFSTRPPAWRPDIGPAWSASARAT
jgi:hypothetical protein